MESEAADHPFLSLPSDWGVESLGNLATKIGSGATPRGGSKAYLHRRANFALVRSQNVFDRRFEPTGIAFISDADAERLRGVRLRTGDVLLNITGDGVTFGRACLAPEAQFPCVVNQHVSIIRCGSRLEPGFLHSFLTTPATKLYIEAFNAGGSRRAITKGHIESFRIPLPPMDEQQRIAAILGALDDKIELNRKMNRTLEEMAQAMFKSWFIDFDGVPKSEMVESELGPIPKGWSVAEIGEVVRVLGGSTPSTKNSIYWDRGRNHWATPKDLSGVSSPLLLSTARRITDEGVGKISSGQLPAGTFLLSSRAPVGYTAISRVPVSVNQGFIAIPPGGGLPSVYLLFWARASMDEIKSRAGGTTFQEISKKSFRPILVAVPSASELDRFVSIAEALFARIEVNERQSRTLTLLRDALLPKLISGEIRVPEAERAMEAAL